MPTEVMNINCIESRFATPRKSFDVDELFHIRQTSLHGQRQPYWCLIVITTPCALPILNIHYFSLHSRLRHFLTHCLSASNSPTSNPAPQTSTSLSPVLDRTETVTETNPHPWKCYFHCPLTTVKTLTHSKETLLTTTLKPKTPLVNHPGFIAEQMHDTYIRSNLAVRNDETATLTH